MKQKIIIESYSKKEKSKTKTIVGLFAAAALAIGVVSYYQDKDDDDNNSQHSGGGGGGGYYNGVRSSSTADSGVKKISSGAKGGIGSSATSGGAG